MVLNEIAIKRNILTLMAVVAAIVFGYNSYKNLGVDLFPDVEFPFVTIQTILVGADPETVESTITTKIEDEISTLSGIEESFSISAESLSFIFIKFDLEQDVNIAAQDVRDKLSTIRSDLPDDIDEPIVQKMDFNAQPILTLVVTSKESMQKTSKYVEDYIKMPLQNIDGVGTVNIVGDRERQIRIWIDPKKLQSYDLSPTDISRILQMGNVEIPGGKIEEGKSDISIKTKGNIERVEEFKDLVVKYKNGSTIRLKDVARIEDGLENKETIARYKGAPAISLEIKKQSGANTVAVAKQVKERLDMIQKQLPTAYKIEIANDSSEFIENSINAVFEDLIIAGILAVLVTFFFLRNIRTTLMVAIVIPATLISSFTLMQAIGFTINMMTTLAMSISVGILIDDVIVMIENIYRHFETGKDRLTSAKEGSGEISFAVISIGFTIMCVFVPVAFMKGIVGKFFYEFGLTISFIIALSMLLSLTFTPMLASKFLKRIEKPNILSRGIERLLVGLEKFYKGILKVALNHRFKTLLIGIGALVLGVYLTNFVPKEFSPEEDRGVFYLEFKAPLGTSLEQTSELASIVEQKLMKKFKEIDNIYTAVGADGQKTVNKANITIKLVGLEEREKGLKQIIKEARSEFEIMKKDALLADCEFTMTKPGMGGDGDAAIQYVIKGNNFKELNTIATNMLAEWKKIPGLVDIKNTYEAGKPEVGIYINRDKAASVEIAASQIAQTINMLFSGTDISKFREGGEQYDVWIQLEKQYRNEIADFDKIYLRAKDDKLVSLSNVTYTDQAVGPSLINHRSRMRSIVLEANLDGVVAGEVTTKIENITKKMNLPPGYSADFIGAGKEMGKAFGYMFEALILAIILIYIVIASQFNSLVHPITIMLSLPLSLIGVFFFLFVTQTSLNIFSMIGVIMLMGLVCKNAILLIDFTIQQRNKGFDKHEALLIAGPIRLRPIMMTTIAMISAMTPISLGLGDGGEMRAPMAIAVIGGLLTSSLLTLVIVPVIYSYLDVLSTNRFITRFIRFISKEEKQQTT